jgi:hypothetical protein
MSLLRALVQAQKGASKTAHEANEAKNETMGLLTRRRPGPGEGRADVWLVVLAEDTRFELVRGCPQHAFQVGAAMFRQVRSVLAWACAACRDAGDRR